MHYSDLNSVVLIVSNFVVMIDSHPVVAMNSGIPGVASTVLGLEPNLVSTKSGFLHNVSMFLSWPLDHDVCKVVNCVFCVCPDTIRSQEFSIRVLSIEVGCTRKSISFTCRNPNESGQQDIDCF